MGLRLDGAAQNPASRSKIVNQAIMKDLTSAKYAGRLHNVHTDGIDGIAHKIFQVCLNIMTSIIPQSTSNLRRHLPLLRPVVRSNQGRQEPLIKRVISTNPAVHSTISDLITVNPH